MNRFRVTIRSAMALVLFACVGFAALRDPSVWWVGGLLASLTGLLLTACVGAMYRTGRERAFWLGIVVFGGGYVLLNHVLQSDPGGNPQAITDRILKMVPLDRSVPAVGVPVLAEKNGEFRPAWVLQVDRDRGAYFVNYEGWTAEHNAWLSLAQVRLQGGPEHHAVCHLLVVILIAMIGSVVAVAFHDSSESRRGERPSPALSGNRE